MDTRPKYAHLEYEVREQLNISWSDYVLLDMIYHLSRNRWCNKKQKKIAQDMGLTVRGIRKTLIRLEKDGLLKQSEKGYKTTSKYDNTKLKKEELSSPSAQKHRNSVPQKEELSSSQRGTQYTNNREQINNEINLKNNGEGYKKFLEAKARLGQKLTLSR